MLMQRIKRRLAEKDGFTLVEVLLVTVILGILAAIIVPNIANASRMAKVKAFASELATVQSAVDQFYAVSSVFPAATQPAGTNSAELDETVADANGRAFYPRYVRMIPNSDPNAFNLNAADGATVYYGITGDGKVFATQAAPANWNGNTLVYIQEEVQKTTDRPKSVKLSDIGGAAPVTP